MADAQETERYPAIDPDVEPIDFEQAIQTALEGAEDPDSHVERDPGTFHASQVAYCKRRCYCSKLGLDDQRDILGVFRTGTLIHEFLEERLARHVRRAQFERPVETEVDGVRFVGRADCFDPYAGTVYDFKTRASWYNFDPPVGRHLDQLHVYMAALGAEHGAADRGQVVYLSKSDLEVRTWPEDGVFEFDQERFDRLVAKAQEVRDAVDEHGVAQHAEEIPFEPCGCYFCREESLAIPGGDD